MLFVAMALSFSASTAFAENGCERFYRGQVLVAQYQKQLIIGTLHTRERVRVERLNSNGWSVDVYFLHEGRLMEGIGCIDLQIMTGMRSNPRGYEYIYQF